jgi:hypothetical protein
MPSPWTATAFRAATASLMDVTRKTFTPDDGFRSLPVMSKGPPSVEAKACHGAVSAGRSVGWRLPKF